MSVCPTGSFCYIQTAVWADMWVDRPQVQQWRQTHLGVQQRRNTPAARCFQRSCATFVWGKCVPLWCFGFCKSFLPFLFVLLFVCFVFSGQNLEWWQLIPVLSSWPWTESFNAWFTEPPGYYYFFMWCGAASCWKQHFLHSSCFGIVGKCWSIV